MNPRLIIYEDDHLQVAHRADAGELCICAFTGIGHGMSGVHLQSPEFTKMTRHGSKIFIIDKTRSWGNNLDVGRIRDVVFEISDGRPVMTLGNSMGAFLAILMSGPLEAKSCIAFSPQWSVHPDTVPFETRWEDYRQAIRDWRFPSLEKAFAPDCKYHVFFGDVDYEIAHQKLFPELDNLVQFIVPGADHRLAHHLKSKSVLYPIIQSAALSALHD